MYSFFFHLDTFEYINSLTKLMINFGLRHFSFYMEAEVKSLKMRTTEECIDVRKASLLFSESRIPLLSFVHKNIDIIWSLIPSVVKNKIFKISLKIAKTITNSIVWDLKKS